MKSLRKTASVFNVGISTIKRWKKRNWVVRSEYAPRKCSPTIIDFIKGIVAQDPFITCQKMSDKVLEALGTKISRRLVATVLKRERIVRVRARRGVPANRETQRIAAFGSFRERLEAAIASNKPIISVDETGVTDRTVALTGYTNRGQRLWVPRRTERSTRINIVMAITRSEILHMDRTQSNVNGSDFAQFIANLPAPSGSVILLDNAAFHKTHAVKEAARVLGFELLFVPPYTPDANPIENVFGILKSYVRQSTSSNTHERVAQSVERVRARAEEGVFQRCFRRSLDWIRSQAAANDDR